MNNVHAAVMNNSLMVFEKYLKSTATKKMYRYLFMRFLKWSAIKDADELLQLKESHLQSIVEDYILYMRNRISPNSFQPVIAALELFFSMNDKILNWKKIHRMIPTFVKKSGNSAWQTNDIQKMLDGTASARIKALIHFLSSTGCRVGAVSDLKIKDLSDMPDGCKAVVFYEGTNEEYFGFLIQEANNALGKYLDERRRDGEYLDDQSPIFRSSYQVGVEKARPLSSSSIHLIMHRIVKKIDTRKRVGRRFDIMLLHGFRKRFATSIKLDKTISYSVGERLLGHKAYLDPEYFAPTKENLFQEFRKVMLNLLPILVI
jgi:integrase